MPYYADLNLSSPQAGREWEADMHAHARTLERLQALRAALSDPEHGGPPPRRPGSLLLATWNLREFDSPTWGLRLPEAYVYMAEIIDRFDLVAIQEVREDLRALDRLRGRLGHHWKYLVSDVTEGKAGNGERLAFLYDTHAVQFLGMAGELVLPPVSADGKLIPAVQVARTPLMAGFQAGWTKFVLATVHIIYGDESAAPAARIGEIRQVARFLRERTESPTEFIRNIIVLGDFNIFSATDATMKALTDDGGFTIPQGIQDIPGSNVDKNKRYDQIAYRARPDRFNATGRAGVFDYFDIVFTDDDEPIYRRYIDAYIDERQAGGQTSPAKPADEAESQRQYRTWRTYQISDHLPLWTEFRVDFADAYLAELAAQPLPK